MIRLSFLLATFAAALPLSASVLTSTAPGKPSLPTLSSYEAPAGASGNTSAYLRADGSSRDVGQTFVLLAPGKVSGFTTKLWRDYPDAAGKEMTVRILRMKATNVRESGAPVHEESGLLPGKLGKGDYITFTFSNAAILEPGVYLVMFGFAGDSVEKSRVIGFERSNDATSFGRLWVLTDGKKFSSDSKTTTLFVHGE